MASTPILDLSTLIDSRPPIRIDGKPYHLKSPEELSLLEAQQFTSWGKRLEELGKEAGDTAALEALVREVAQAACADVPEAVFAKLSTSQMMAIVEVFTSLLLGRRLRLAGAIAGQVVGSQSIGANSFPASNSPSAATPDGGSPKPQPHS